MLGKYFALSFKVHIYDSIRVCIIFSVTLVLGLLIGADVDAIEDASSQFYPINQVERPLTLPNGMWEYTAGAAVSSPDTVLRPLLGLRYSFTDNAEYNFPALLKYRLIGTQVFDFAVMAGLAGFGYSSIDGKVYIGEIGGVAKYRFNQELALFLRAKARSERREKTWDKSDSSISLGVLFMLSDFIGVEIESKYAMLERIEKYHERSIGTTFTHSKRSGFDVQIFAEFNDFSGTHYQRRFADSYEQWYGVRLNWRH